MATNLLRQLGGRARTMVRRVYTAVGVIRRARESQANKTARVQHQAVRAQQQAVKAHQRGVKAKVKGVQRTTRSVTKGSRIQRAQQLRQMRANPQTRQQLRRRAQFYTI